MTEQVSTSDNAFYSKKGLAVVLLAGVWIGSIVMAIHKDATPKKQGPVILNSSNFSQVEKSCPDTDIQWIEVTSIEVQPKVFDVEITAICAQTKSEHKYKVQSFK